MAVDVASLVDTLGMLDGETAVQLINQVLRARPELTPAIVGIACPELTYAPAKAMTERRSKGVIKSFNQHQGFGFIACPELAAVFGKDVFIHGKQMGSFDIGSEVSFAVTLSEDNKPQAYDVQHLMPGMMQSPMHMQLHMQQQQQQQQHQQQQIMMMQGMGKGATGKAGWGGGWASGGWAASGCGMGGWGGDYSAGWGDMSSGWADHGGPATHATAGWGDPMRGCKRGKGGGCCFPGGGYAAAACAAPGPGAEAQDAEATTLGQFSGSIRSFNEKNGFGFIECTPLRRQGYDKDVFLHQSQRGGLAVGTEVTFVAYLNTSGQLRARAVQPSGTAGLPGPPGAPPPVPALPSPDVPPVVVAPMTVPGA